MHIFTLKAAVSLLLIFQIACQSNKSDIDPNNLLSGLTIKNPGADWKAYQKPHLQSWFKANHTQTDEDLVALYIEAVIPTEPIIGKTPEEQLLNVRDQLKLADREETVSLETDQLNLHPVLRYHSYQEDKRGASVEILRLLGIQRRPSRESYYRRDKSIYLLHPDPRQAKHMALKLGITRSSAHGLIGSFYEEKAYDFISHFLRENLQE